MAQFVHLLKCWLCDVWSGIAMKNRAHSVDRYQLQALQSSMLLTDLLNMLLRFNGVQKAVVNQTGSRPPNSNNDLSLV